MSQPPAFSFKCPLVWQTMRGDEHARHCEVCHKTVRNISLLSPEERDALLRANEGDLCVAYYTHVNGELATLETLQQRSSWKLVQRGVAGIAASAVLVTAGCATRPKAPMSAHTPQTENATSEDHIVLTAFGMICPPGKPAAGSGSH